MKKDINNFKSNNEFNIKAKLQLIWYLYCKYFILTFLKIQIKDLVHLEDDFCL